MNYDNADYAGSEQMPEVRVMGLEDEARKQPQWVDNPNLTPFAEQELFTFSVPQEAQ